MLDFARETFAEAVEYHRLMRDHLLHLRARLYAIEMASDPEVTKLTKETRAELERNGRLEDAVPAEEFVARLRALMG